VDNRFQFVEPDIGIGNLCINRLKSVTVLYNPVTSVVIFCALVVLILFGEFVHGVNQELSGSLSLRIYFSEIIKIKRT
jgi:hypothetical protein